MRIGELGHLTYCTNIHPGEDWREVFSQLERHLPSLKAQVSPERPFGVGLRLSAVAAQQLGEASELASFQDWLAERDLYVFTLNGFPFGRFHGEPVKQAVYRPDWSHPSRLTYTCQLADILAALLPEGLAGSISTLPGAFKPDIVDPRYRQSIVANLVAAAAHLRHLARETGKTIRLALEPEPGCLLETCEETLGFFRDEIFVRESIEGLENLTGESSAACEEHLRQHLTVCLDTCHASVMFEEPLATARRLTNAGIGIGKIQLTAALAIDSLDMPALTQLQAFEDPVYLHQTTVLQKNTQRRFLDLPEAFAAFTPDMIGSGWRSHYHVPVFLQDLGLFRTTSPELASLLRQHRETPFSDHLEVETYTFDVLPKQYRLDQVTDNISREIQWVRRQLQP